jgi:hypothetical protein
MIHGVLRLIEFSMMMTRPASGTHNPAMPVIYFKRHGRLSMATVVTPPLKCGPLSQPSHVHTLVNAFAR